jgi:site-specific DNA-methyltransferase (adenine-specific)
MLGSPLNRIISGNCVGILRRAPAEIADLTVTSPPYDDLRLYKGYAFDFESVAAALWRATKPGGVVVWVVGDETIDGSETGTSFRQALGFLEVGFKLFDTMIYEKTGTSFPSKGRYTSIFEFMFVLAKGQPKTFNPICDVPKLWEGSWGKTTQRQKDGSLEETHHVNCGKAKSGRATDGRYGYKQRTNIWRIVNGKKFGHRDELAYQHPATFPEALARDHILTWTNPGDLVLDPMCGSGTVPVMAVLQGRTYLGIDISPEYVELTKRRIELRASQHRS